MPARTYLFLNNQGLDQRGGGPTILRRLCAHLAPRHRVLIAAHSRTEEDVEGVEQLLLPPPGEPRGPLWRLAPLLRARHLTRVLATQVKERVDCVVNLDTHFADAAAQVRTRKRVYLSLSAIPRQEWANAEGAGRALRFLQYATLERRCIRRADLTIVASAFHRDEIRRAELLPRFEPLVLPPLFADPTGELRPKPVGPVTVLSIGRLVPLKRFRSVARIAAATRDLDVRFELLGDGPERARIERQIERWDVSDRVRIHPSARPAAFLPRAHVLFHPSRYESFGIAVFEGMLNGLAVLAGRRTKTVRTAIPEFVTHGREGMLCDVEDPEDAAAALRELVSDRAALERLGAAARERALGLLRETDYPRRFEAAVEELFA